ncbi:ShlB/FhaC/HecB family hemolysin secretion/activation protein [Enterobacter sp. D2]|nr:ShlB/FhaC/HecB family hemolysin secretion/activation protein [Enterobacter sp. D2]MDZ5727137.1 ShlB/FhaC/HecB family hemolysin secretion/activation protein [Enterobacter sp. D2]HCM9117010.1 ShlB/FhaC/HecB family hemolysin secretion/activation protein [Enterobacter asburiae]HCM9580443.1 ShlB/FhaC/HecB family hemolysin secretion/activation protein [Enterobacter asburiae]
MKIYQAALSFLFLSLCLMQSSLLHAEPATIQQQDQARHEQLAPPGKLLLTAESTSHGDALVLPKESVCYDILHVRIDNTESLPNWLTFRDFIRQAENNCIGVKGIKAIYTAVQNRLISHGFITTRVLIPEQNLLKGTLTLRILPGRVSDVIIQDQSGLPVHRWNNIPQGAGDLLDLRGLEQGLENLQRIPGSQASIRLVPGENPGDSRVEIKRDQRKVWRLGSWFDDSGSKYTGRYQGGLVLYLDNPTSLNDMFYVAYGGGFKNENGKRNDNTSAFYSVPWGYWALELYASQYRTTQTIHSGDFDYRYSSDQKLMTAALNRVVYRSASQKTTLGFKGIKRDTRYDLNDMEVEVQHRDTSSWLLSLEHLAYLPFGQLTASLGYQHAAPWFGEEADAEEVVGNADAQARIITLSADGSFPFKLGKFALSYEPHFKQQTTPDRLTQPDKFTIGNRWTVRGFDGESSLYADKGWYLRNDINLNLPVWGMQPYIGADYGEVSGSENDYWSGAHILGAAAGVRGVKGHVGYDLFAGVPLVKPDEMHTSPVTLGFSVQWQY